MDAWGRHLWQLTVGRRPRGGGGGAGVVGVLGPAESPPPPPRGTKMCAFCCMLHSFVTSSKHGINFLSLGKTTRNHCETPMKHRETHYETPMKHDKTLMKHYTTLTML